MKAKLPSFGAYAVAYNLINSNYCWKECIRNALTFCDKFYILDGHSDDGTFEAIQDEFKDTPGVVLKRAKEPWDFDDSCIVGKRKQEAREMVKEDYCVYLDLDEILLCRNSRVIYDMVLQNPNFEVFSLPYFTFFGDVSKIANFKEAENFWRWKIFKNLPHIGHGPHGTARKYDENGRIYIDKKISDGCELINMQTLEVMPNMMFAPPAYLEAGMKYREAPTDEREKNRIGSIFTEVANDFPLVVLHYGWIDFENKAKNALAYWTKTKAYKTGAVEHSRLFDGITPEKIEEKVKQWKAIDTIQVCLKEHPQIMKPYLAMSLKPRISVVSLSNSGPYGVPKWNKLLKQQLHQYDVQLLAFEDYVANSPPNAPETAKAESFMQYIQQQKLDHNSVVLIGDGFWPATYKGPAKVVSVIHGLWSHPLRDKWDDGLLQQRQELFKYQLSYYKQARQMGHTLVCVSPLIHKILQKEHGIDSLLIPNSIDLDFYDKVKLMETDVKKKTKPIILHGITSVNKGLDILPAFKEHPLIKEKFDVLSLDEITQKFGCSKEMAFKFADIAFLPTKWEASSFLLLECLASNLPIVAYRAGILRCDGLAHLSNVGIIVDDYNVDTFAKSIKEATENSMKYLMGRLFIKDNGFTLDKWTASMAKLIYEVL